MRTRPRVLIVDDDATDYGPHLGTCGACGFVPKAGLSGAALDALPHDL